MTRACVVLAVATALDNVEPRSRQATGVPRPHGPAGNPR